MLYLIGTGWDVALESLAPLVIQPATIGLQYERRTYAAGGAVIDENPFWELTYNNLGTIARYQALLSQCGLLTAKTAPVSFYGPDENFDPILRNCIAVKPQIGQDGQRDNYFLRNFVILLKSLTVQA